MHLSFFVVRRAFAELGKIISILQVHNQHILARFEVIDGFSFEESHVVKVLWLDLPDDLQLFLFKYFELF